MLTSIVLDTAARKFIRVLYSVVFKRKDTFFSVG